MSILITPEVLLDDAHVYSQDGVVCPRSATGLLKKYGIGPDYAAMPQHNVENARIRGNAVDMGMRLIAMGIEIDSETISPVVAPYLHAFSKFWNESGAELIEVGTPRISPLGYGFTVDLLVWLFGLRTVLDGKATHKIPKSVGPQTAFYEMGQNSIAPWAPVKARGGLWLRPNGTYKLKKLDDPDDFACAMDCLNEDIRPGQTKTNLNKWRNKYGE